MKKWKTVIGFKNVVDEIYQVSYNGYVRKTLTKEIMHQKVANRRLHPYYAVYLHINDGKGSWILVHQLVATFFCEKPVVESSVELVPDHLDNNGLNNHFMNLEWKTRAENTLASIERGEIDNRCENGRNAVITNDQAHTICKMLADGFSYDDIITTMNFQNNKKYRTLLVRIKNGIAWTDISKKYKIDKNQVKFSGAAKDTLNELPRILALIDDGYTNKEIAKIIWGSDNNRLKSKSETVRKIRNKEIFQAYYSTTFND